MGVEWEAGELKNLVFLKVFMKQKSYKAKKLKKCRIPITTVKIMMFRRGLARIRWWAKNPKNVTNN